ncbi:MAG: DUF1697 domain-containing protein [Vulcanimicrobiaceae bacterium]
MNGLAFVRERIGTFPMPMAELFGLELVEAARGAIHARAQPSSRHYNPLGVVQGGFAEVRTLLQTGNLVFRGGAPFDVELEHLLEARALERLDLRTDFLVRSATQWGRIVSGNPC